MKHLLLVTNVLEEGSTLQYAAKFCQHYKAKLHILNIDDRLDPILVSSPYYYQKFLFNHKISTTNKVVAEVKSKVGSVLDAEWLDIAVKGGNADGIIKNMINDNFIDFILIDKSTIELANLVKYKHLFFDALPTPLIVIPKFEKFKPFKSFDFLTTHSMNDVKSLKALTGYFPNTKITLTNLVSKEKSESEISADNKWFDFVQTETKTKFKYNRSQLQIEQYINKDNLEITHTYDGIVFTTKPRNTWSRLLDPSTTLHMLTSLDTPAFVFKLPLA